MKIINLFKKGSIFIILLTSTSFVYSQLSNEHDCLGAISLCQPIYHQPNTISAVGNITGEINVGSNQCLIDEIGGIWYKFTPSTTDTLRFSIIPDNPSGEDFDWALFDLSGASCSDLATGNPYNYLISANSAGASSSLPPLQNQGPTGINGNYAIVGSASCVGPGAGSGSGVGSSDWNTYNNDVVVTAGKIYYLYVAQFSGSQGYTIDFTPSQASIVNDYDATITTVVDSICISAANINYTAIDSGGIWEGIGIIDSIHGIFSPNAANPGIHKITYTIGGVCSVTDSTYITVIASPEAIFNYSIENELCTEKIIYLENNSLNSNRYYWYNEDIYFSNSMNTSFSLQNGENTNITLVSMNERCQDTSSLIIGPFSQKNPVVSNVFSSNNDGINDLFELTPDFKACSTNIEIFNRWGVKVYTSNNVLEWNGKTLNGAEAPSGTYFYIFLINDIEYKGTLTLLR